MSENFSLGLVNENFDEWNFTFFSCCIMVKTPKNIFAPNCNRSDYCHFEKFIFTFQVLHFHK